MKQLLLSYCMVGMLAASAGIASAGLVPWDAATANIPADPTVARAEITSITAGGHTFPASELAFGVSNGNTGSDDGFGPGLSIPLNSSGGPNSVDDFFTYVEVFNAEEFTTDFTGLSGGGYTQRNGSLHDFFLGQASGNDDFQIFATYSLDGGESTAEGINLSVFSGFSPNGDWGGTGLNIAYSGQELAGVAWGVEDMFDDSGANLPANALITAVRIEGGGGGGLDTQMFAVHVGFATNVLPLAPSAIYSVRDDDSDGIFDDLGDVVVDVLANNRNQVGEFDSSTANRMNRLVAKFELPDLPALQSATLRFFLQDIFGAPEDPVSLLHSIIDNDLELLASDYENPSYVYTLLDLIQHGDAGGQYYELDVTDLVLADYAADGANPLSAFRLEVSEAVLIEDNQRHSYRLEMPGLGTNPPQLILVFNIVPEPSTLTLAALALVGLVGWGRRRRAE